MTATTIYPVKWVDPKKPQRKATTLRLATPVDEPALRRLLRDNPMPGSISLSYEREPDYFIATRVEGSLSQTIVNVDEATGAFLGMGTRIINPMYVNGQMQNTGYMSHLRTDLSRSWGLSLARELARSFGKFHDLHADGRAPFYLMSVIADNASARRLLTAALPGMPQAFPYTRMFTYVISPRRMRREIPLPNGINLTRGTREQLPAIVDCLQRNGQQMQFSPYWSIENLCSATQTPNLHPQDFFLAMQSDRVVGCLAVWNQTSFKQTVVRGYQGNLARWRAVINLLARVIDLPHLPPVGTPISYCYASHLAIDDLDPRVFAALLRAVYNDTLRRGFNYFMIGLSETNPLRQMLTRSYLHLPYPSQIYLMAWDDGLEAIKRVDGRLPAPEIALL